ncbi:MAG: hypothetical protein ABI864_06185 [Chloroflexota bacterium]
MRRQLVSVGLAILAAGGCAMAAPAWPAGFREAICSATGNLQAADLAFAEAVDGVAAAESERVAIAAAGMERESDRARALLIAAPGWAAGGQLATELSTAATGFGRAASDFGIGARQGDGPALDRAVASAQDADAALARADREGKRLQTAIGWLPC